MKVLLLGHSAIAKKRILPALRSMREVSEVEVASRSAADANYSDYEVALGSSDAELVYVSLVNRDHAPWTERALEAGRHVVVDKPAFLDFDSAQRLVELSRKRGVGVAEATVYTRHPQIAEIGAQFAHAHSEPTRIAATFSFPPLPESDFRYRKALGGGALYDLGPYAASPGRHFFGGRPEDVECRVLSRGGADSVETAFHVAMQYRDGRSMVGQFGFDTAYCNRLSVLGSELCIDVDRVFTTPPELENELRISDRSGRSVVPTQAADGFAGFLREVLRRIQSRDLDALRNDLLDDAFVLDWMRRSAGVA